VRELWCALIRRGREGNGIAGLNQPPGTIRGKEDLEGREGIVGYGSETVVEESSHVFGVKVGFFLGLLGRNICMKGGGANANSLDEAHRTLDRSCTGSILRRDLPGVLGLSREEMIFGALPDLELIDGPVERGCGRG